MDTFLLFSFPPVHNCAGLHCLPGAFQLPGLWDLTRFCCNCYWCECRLFCLILCSCCFAFTGTGVGVIVCLLFYSSESFWFKSITTANRSIVWNTKQLLSVHCSVKTIFFLLFKIAFIISHVDLLLLLHNYMIRVSSFQKYCYLVYKKTAMHLAACQPVLFTGHVKWCLCIWCGNMFTINPVGQFWRQRESAFYLRGCCAKR